MLAAVAEAQELSAGISGYAPFGLYDLDGKLPLSAELRFSMPIADRLAFEPFVTAGPDFGHGWSSPQGFYGVQIRQRLVRLTNGFAFATYGVAGGYSRAAGGVWPPVIGHFGFGLKQRVSKHLSFRPEVHLVTLHVIPVGARLVAGFSVDAGR